MIVLFDSRHVKQGGKPRSDILHSLLKEDLLLSDDSSDCGCTGDEAEGEEEEEEEEGDEEGEEVEEEEGIREVSMKSRDCTTGVCPDSASSRSSAVQSRCTAATQQQEVTDSTAPPALHKSRQVRHDLRVYYNLRLSYK